jgi:hypothetical protein
MSRRASGRKMLTPLAVAEWNRALLFARADSILPLCNLPSITSHVKSLFAWRAGIRNATHRKLRGTHFPSFIAGKCSGEQNRKYCCRITWASIYMRALQTGSFQREPSLPDSPMSHSVTRSLLFPRPAALGVLLCAAHTLRVWVSKEKISLWPKVRARFFLRSLHRKHACGLGSGAVSRHFVQECPE